MSPPPTQGPDASPDTSTPLPELTESSSPPGAPLLRLGDLSELPLFVEVPLGTIDVSIRGLLDLRPGSVLQLDRITGDTFDVTVNGTAVAKGEIRIHGERFAIRITEVLHADRLDRVEGDESHESPLEGHP